MIILENKEKDRYEYKLPEKIKGLSARQYEILKDNLRSYLVNFRYIAIAEEDYGDGFMVYTDENRTETGSYTQYCYNIDYLNGWLYGAVQAANKIMKKEEEIA